ncbi:MAG: alpha/beta fold hydrolase [Polyangiales bacterium]
MTSNGTATDFLVPWAAHAWTIVPNLLHAARARLPPAAEPWSTTLDDPRIGTLTLHGELRREVGPYAKHCVVVVHGLGGSIDRPYCIQAALAAQRAGLSCLRVSLRGADRRGEDFYHAGLSVDIAAAIASPALASFDRLYVLGYSLGGHVTLHYALQAIDPRVRAVAAVCAPLDLDLSALHIDGRGAALYRRHVLAGLKEIYAAVAAKHTVPTPLRIATAARRIRDWDRLTVVPRFGFESVEAYYATQSVGPRLAELTRPALLVQSSVDPMVPPWTYERHLARTLPQLSVRRLRAGGHVAFPRLLGADGSAKRWLEDQILDWFCTQ